MRQWWARVRRLPRPGFDPQIWADAQAGAKEPFRGETVEEPFVRRRLQDLRGRLVRIRLGDEGQRTARARLAAASIRGTVAAERSRQMEERVQLAVLDARENDRGAEPQHSIRIGADRDVPLAQRQAGQERLLAAEELQKATEADRVAGTALYDRLMEAATTGLESINEYIAAYNYACTYERRRGLAPLPDRFAEEIVDAVIAVGSNG